MPPKQEKRKWMAGVPSSHPVVPTGPAVEGPSAFLLRSSCLLCSMETRRYRLVLASCPASPREPWANPPAIKLSPLSDLWGVPPAAGAGFPSKGPGFSPLLSSRWPERPERASRGATGIWRPYLPTWRERIQMNTFTERNRSRRTLEASPLSASSRVAQCRQGHYRAKSRDTSIEPRGVS